ncbi:hypothetical protein Bca101_042244 [Brassica carinata]
MSLSASPVSQTSVTGVCHSTFEFLLIGRSSQNIVAGLLRFWDSLKFKKDSEFMVPSIFDNQGNYNDSVAESLDFMLSYHDNHHPDSTFLIEETNQYVMNLMRENHNIISQHLQVTLAIRDYNLNATARLDVDLIITDLEVTRQPKRKTRYAPSVLRITPM